MSDTEEASGDVVWAVGFDDTIARMVARGDILIVDDDGEPAVMLAGVPWNKCAKCGQLVDCDDVHDGCEVRCLGCGAVNVVVEAGDGSFSLALQGGV